MKTTLKTLVQEARGNKTK